MDVTSRRIGFIGVGAMGQPMALNLREAGFGVAVYDPRADRLGALREAGAVIADNPSIAAQGADTLVVMVRTHDQLQDALFSENGAAATLAAGSLAIVMSTIAPAQARGVAERLRQQGVQMLDAPVSGGVRGASAGRLTIMCGGPRDVVDRARPTLEAMGDAEAVWHVGPNIGDGQTMKMINQILVGVHIVATAEAMTMARKSGLDLDMVQRIIGQSMGASRLFVERAPYIAAGDLDSGRSRLDIMVKDMRVVAETAEELGVPLLVSIAAQQAFKLATARGHGDGDDNGVVRIYGD
jgi:3-hydroxyisobutyrate dehydrogenase